MMSKSGKSQHIKIGTLFVISAPSGTGKTSLVIALLKKIPYIKLSVSYTTRPMRPGETDGVDYHFIEKEAFQKMIQNREFLEYAEVFGNHYGTAKHNVEVDLYEGHDVILEIDWQGAKQIREMFPGTRSIFILPPSKSALASRISARNQNSPEDLELRLQTASHEVAHYEEYDFLIVNDKFEAALLDLETIFQSERFRLKYQKHHLRELIKVLL